MSILDELSSLVTQAEQVKAREEQMLGMFELAGYSLVHEPEVEAENLSSVELDETDEDLLESKPKTLIELLKEALGNPPTEPGQWIRVKDIPRYISENLNVPEDIDAFNESASSTIPSAPLENTEFANTVLDSQPGQRIIPSGYSRAGTEEYKKGADCPDKADYVDTVGRVWHKERDERWTLEGDDDLGGYRNVDADDFGPLIPITSIRNRSRRL